MATARVGGIDLDHERYGEPGDPAMLLIMGLGSQRIMWADELIAELVDAGLQVITFDNRDAGRSTVLDGPDVGGAVLLAALNGEPVPAPYGLGDMAVDAVGLLDHLGIDHAHVVGASMGGMIAQHLAFDHPERVRSLVSIMSTTGQRGVGRATEEALAALYTPAPTERAAFIADAVAKRRITGSRVHFDELRTREIAGRVFDRGISPAGTARQLAAILTDRDRTDRLGRIEAPTLVIHGTDDALVDVSGGEATARAIPGAELLVVEDMGHDLPLPLLSTIAAAIIAHAHTAQPDTAAVRS
jgi:pimeloyl-ACP methyl ester carboxylesterase